jgi:hypothetical protein
MLSLLQEGQFANTCPNLTTKDSKGAFKVRKKKEDKSAEISARQVCIRYTDMMDESKDDFISLDFGFVHRISAMSFI